MSKHTAGTWANIGTFVYALNENGTNVFSALVQDAFTSEEELKANAKLISAAPELLEALIEILADGVLAHEPFLSEKARAAIAKATGGES